MKKGIGLILLIFAISFSLKASHIVGGDLTGNGLVQQKMTFKFN